MPSSKSFSLTTSLSIGLIKSELHSNNSTLNGCGVIGKTSWVINFWLESFILLQTLYFKVLFWLKNINIKKIRPLALVPQISLKAATCTPSSFNCSWRLKIIPHWPSLFSNQTVKSWCNSKSKLWLTMKSSRRYLCSPNLFLRAL